MSKTKTLCQNGKSHVQSMAPIWHGVTKKGTPLIKNAASQKLHPTWMASHKYLPPTIRHPQESNKNITLEWEKLDFKIQWPWIWIIQQF